MINLLTAVNNNMQPTSVQLYTVSPSKELGKLSSFLVFANDLNSDKVSRQQNQEIDNFICWHMVNFINVDFQAILSKR